MSALDGLAVITYLIAVFVAAGPSSTTEVRAYADGAPPGFTGGFGEAACDACHFEAAVNTKPGQLTLAGVPERFVAGERYPLTITLSRPGMAMGGFQLSARMETGGAQAGTLAPGPGKKNGSRSSPARFSTRISVWTMYALTEPGLAKWTLVWTAPAASVPSCSMLPRMQRTRTRPLAATTSTQPRRRRSQQLFGN